MLSRWILSNAFGGCGAKCLLNRTLVVINIKNYSAVVPTVQTKQGLLAGSIRRNIDGGEYFAFTGVPFAEQPIGKLRFKEPQPLKPWQGVKNVTEESNSSAQCDLSANLLEGGDDCLYINIATNSLTGKRPVMVWIHGGAFKRSSNTYKKYSPDYLLKKDVVIVSVNYRLGVLGFLNMEHEECAGNQGLKDQVAALKWVQDNIEAFGGDSKNVTLFGESAGAASIHGLCIAPQAKGLFHKAIAQSGVISNPWAHIQSNKEHGYSLAKELGKDCSKPLEAIEFLRTVSAVKLVETYEIIHKRESSKLLLTLVPTSDVKNSDPILPQSVEEMSKKGIDVPFLVGYNSHEGILSFLGDYSNFIKEIEDDFESIISDYLKISDPKRVANIAKVVREFYFGKDKITDKKINELVQLFGDMLFVNDIHKVVENQMEKTTPTYLYRYSYRSDFPGMKERFNSKIEGTCHSDELGCLFFSELRREKLQEGTRDRITMERMTTMWTNFAKTSDPTPTIDDLITTKWLPVEKDKKNYLEINDNLTSGVNPDDNMRQMWRVLL
ncbi:esterase FE4 isoform X1 [Nasonia vitripennis]|uniref:Carboxylic ester hydrolase n=1 Tax=Nasonia vitripennis TaxID=7425 RepID=A0A7M7Q1B4_NASVI|nr:esterase FE4 isoform X1 [Nasonia vitripennis]XP_031780286.1 esterase FE4 isoform X1 [Nasonia vitripennis]